MHCIWNLFITLEKTFINSILNPNVENKTIYPLFWLLRCHHFPQIQRKRLLFQPHWWNPLTHFAHLIFSSLYLSMYQLSQQGEYCHRGYQQLWLNADLVLTDCKLNWRFHVCYRDQWTWHVVFNKIFWYCDDECCRVQSERGNRTNHQHLKYLFKTLWCYPMGSF